VDLREVQVGLPVAQTGVKKVAALREAASEGHETLEADAVQEEVEVVGGVVVRSELLSTDAVEMAEPQLEELLSAEEGGAEREVAPYCWGIQCAEWQLRFC